jgi:hypothetical protein
VEELLDEIGPAGEDRLIAAEPEGDEVAVVAAQPFLARGPKAARASSR